ncbi:hypothetical protein F4823DRAFT_596399 [Ustulina deusta]|nr:hypothetical protein F4823DRAFT_596399 [Ustulina deusta]
MSSQLHLLKSNAVVCAPTAEASFYVIDVTNPDSGCRISIAATKPLPDTLHLGPAHPDWEKLMPQPKDYVWFSHVKKTCGCAALAKSEKTLFETWQCIHMHLRHQLDDNASYAFYPEFEYEVGEALAHASLVASLALGIPVPECYDSLLGLFGARNPQRPWETETEDGDDADLTDTADDSDDVDGPDGTDDLDDPDDGTDAGTDDYADSYGYDSDAHQD